MHDIFIKSKLAKLCSAVLKKGERIFLTLPKSKENYFQLGSCFNDKLFTKSYFSCKSSFFASARSLAFHRKHTCIHLACVIVITCFGLFSKNKNKKTTIFTPLRFHFARFQSNLKELQEIATIRILL